MKNDGFAPFIDEAEIWSVIEREGAPSVERIDDVLAKAREGNGLDMDEAAVLLAPMPEDRLADVYATALKLKEQVYGKRMVLFAPLYVSNLCGNSCSYCAFSVKNKDLERRSLTPDEIREEVRIIEQMGHKRILAVYGEHPVWNAKAIAESIEVMYSVKTPPSGEIRRINVNCAPLDAEGFATLKSVGIGTFQCFQETYHRETYAAMHPGGRKKDYDWRVFAMHRANEGGIDDVGIGALFGLFDHRFEVLAMMQHAAALEELYGAGPHTISFPRIEPAQNSEISHNPPNVITDDVFKRIIAVVRLAMPYTGMIITTREKPELKRELLRLGISQLSAASRTYPGGYAAAKTNREDAQQFWVGDSRGLNEIVRDLQVDGYIPSFCTSCYRKGRTGEHFMGLAHTAFIHNFCQPNALTTYYEYLCDYGDEEAVRSGKQIIDRAVDDLPGEKERETMRKTLKRVEQGERDICV